MSTKHTATDLLKKLSLAEERVAEYKPLTGILEAAAAGKTIQYYNGSEWIFGDNLTFCDPPERYRVKPETLKFRNVMYRLGNRSVVMTITERDQAECPRETCSDFVRWVGDWQEVEVTQVA